uniref:Uncharacterized protein n=1 Tax=Lotharella oceanica TaxID=641309 RepID=A0A7S2U6I5_9EUKA
MNTKVDWSNFTVPEDLKCSGSNVLKLPSNNRLAYVSVSGRVSVASASQPRRRMNYGSFPLKGYGWRKLSQWPLAECNKPFSLTEITRARKDTYRRIDNFIHNMKHG